mgnify:CR=1 FL=1
MTEKNGHAESTGPTIDSLGQGYQLVQSQPFAQPVDELFDYFRDPENLEEITPDRLKFRILDADPLPVREGTVIEYRLRLRGIPLSWTTEITAFEPNEYFQDTMIDGPYRKWEHIHTFERVNGRTVMGDQVHYELPYGWLGELVHELLIKRDLKHIFQYRARTLRDRFGPAYR